MLSELDDLRSMILSNKARLDSIEKEQHRIDKQLVEIKADLHYIKTSQDSLHANLSRFLWIVGGGFIAAAVSYIVRGGISGN
jgi:chromosome segregation ATPase